MQLVIVTVIACLRGQYRNYYARHEGAAQGPCAIISVLHAHVITSLTYAVCVWASFSSARAE